MKIRQGIRAICFLLIFAVLFAYVDKVFRSKWTTVVMETYTANQYYETKKNTIDALVIGSSQVTYANNTVDWYKEYGITGFTIGSGSAPLYANYYWLREVNEDHKVQVVLLDTSMLYESVKEVNYRKPFDTMKMSLNKLEAVYHHTKIFEGSDTLDSYIIPLMKYHTRWEELGEEDYRVKDGEGESYRGYAIGKNCAYVKESSILLTGEEDIDSELTMEAEEEEYLYKIMDYCEKNDIPLVLFKTPKSSWNYTKHVQVQKIADEKNIPFLDFNMKDLAEEISLDCTRDFRDREHLNVYGATKMSNYLGAYIHDNYALKDHREENTLSEEFLASYDAAMEKNKIYANVYFTDYMQLFENEKYDFVISLTKDMSKYWVEKYDTELAKYGLEIDPTKNYIAYISKGKVVKQKSSSKEIKFSSQLSDGAKIFVRSDIEKDAGNHSFTIDGERYFFPEAGVNILVYDTKAGELVEYTTFRYGSRQDAFIKIIKE